MRPGTACISLYRLERGFRTTGDAHGGRLLGKTTHSYETPSTPGQTKRHPPVESPPLIRRLRKPGDRSTKSPLAQSPRSARHIGWIPRIAREPLPQPGKHHGQPPASSPRAQQGPIYWPLESIVDIPASLRPMGAPTRRGAAGPHPILQVRTETSRRPPGINRNRTVRPTDRRPAPVGRVRLHRCGPALQLCSPPGLQCIHNSKAIPAPSVTSVTGIPKRA
jgi:hypothetical protein